MTAPGTTRRFAHLSPADALTLATAVCGLLVVAAAAGAPAGERLSAGRLAIVGGLLLGATVGDVADGWAARRFGASPLGGQLDLLADAVAFGVGPAALLVASGEADGVGARLLLAAGGAVYLIAALVRLARFATDATEERASTFCGLPTPMGAVGLLAVVSLRPAAAVAFAATVAVAATMLSTRRSPKVRRPVTAALAVGWLAVGGLALAGVLSLRATAALSLAVALGLPFTDTLRRGRGRTS